MSKPETPGSPTCPTTSEAHSIAQSAWARAYYQAQLANHKGHHAAVRALAAAGAGQSPSATGSGLRPFRRTVLNCQSLGWGCPPMRDEEGL